MADGFPSGVVPETVDDHVRWSEGLGDRSTVEADRAYGEGGPGREPEPRTETFEVARSTGTERMAATKMTGFALVATIGIQSIRADERPIRRSIWNATEYGLRI